MSKKKKRNSLYEVCFLAPEKKKNKKYRCFDYRWCNDKVSLCECNSCDNKYCRRHILQLEHKCHKQKLDKVFYENCRKTLKTVDK